jgi:hypothetical protein
MKKIIIVLAVLALAAPALAGVTLHCELKAPKAGVTDANVVVTYDATSEPNLVRAYALGVSVNNGAVIKAIAGYKKGLSTSSNKGYGIFPGTIVIDAGGNVLSWGTPVADAGDPDGPGQLGSGSIVTEQGSLYSGVGNEPAKSGKLFSFTVDKNCAVTIVENALRGGIVMESGNRLGEKGGCNCPVCVGNADDPLNQIINKADITSIAVYLANNATSPLWRVLSTDVNYDPHKDVDKNGIVNKADITAVAVLLANNAAPPLWKVNCP